MEGFSTEPTMFFSYFSKAFWCTVVPTLSAKYLLFISLHFLYYSQVERNSATTKMSTINVHYLSRFSYILTRSKWYLRVDTVNYSWPGQGPVPNEMYQTNLLSCDKEVCTFHLLLMGRRISQVHVNL